MRGLPRTTAHALPRHTHPRATTTYPSTLRARRNQHNMPKKLAKGGIAKPKKGAAKAVPAAVGASTGISKAAKKAANKKKAAPSKKAKKAAKKK